MWARRAAGSSERSRAPRAWFGGETGRAGPGEARPKRRSACLEGRMSALRSGGGEAGCACSSTLPRAAINCFSIRAWRGSVATFDAHSSLCSLLSSNRSVAGRTLTRAQVHTWPKDSKFGESDSKYVVGRMKTRGSGVRARIGSCVLFSS